jgi:hypothetical protein
MGRPFSPPTIYLTWVVLVATLVSLLQTCSPVMAEGDSPDLDSPGMLSGSFVRALSDVYRMATHNGDIDDTDLAELAVTVVGGTTTVVTLSRDGKPFASYFAGTVQDGIRRDEAPSDALRGVGAVKLSGTATKAIATAYQAWKSGSVYVLSTSDLDADRFKIAFHEVTSVRTHDPVYWIDYYPAVAMHVMTGCLVQEAYGVDVVTWRTIVEAAIC